MYLQVWEHGAASIFDTELNFLPIDWGYTHSKMIKSRNVLGVAQPAALQISLRKALHTNDQEKTTLLVECALTLGGQGLPWHW